jgi:hypothetical protein
MLNFPGSLREMEERMRFRLTFLQSDRQVRDWHLPRSSIQRTIEQSGYGENAAGKPTTTEVMEFIVRIFVSEFRSRCNRQGSLKLAMAPL